MNPLLLAQFFGLFTAIAFAAGDTTMRFALRNSTPISGTLVQSLLTLVIYGPFAIATTSPDSLKISGLLLLYAAGIASPGLASIFYYSSFRRIGLSRSSTIIGSSPLVTVIIAVLALGERPRLVVYLGTLLIVIGVISLSRERGYFPPETAGRKSVWHYFLFVFMATLMFGLTAVLRKAGLAITPTLSVAMCVAAIGTLTVVASVNPILPREFRVTLNGPSLRLFLLSGLCLSTGHLSFFAALQRGSVSNVAPLVYTTPIFALAFSWLLLREVERLNARLLFSGILICAGAALVTISRG